MHYRLRAAARHIGRPARLDVLGAVAKALAHLHAEAPCAYRQQRTVQAVTAARVGLQAQQPDRRTGHQRRVQRVGQGRQGCDIQLPLVRRAHKTRPAGERAGPGLAVRIQCAQHDERQLAEEHAVLRRHAVADDARPHLGQRFGRSVAPLQRKLSRVKSCSSHQALPHAQSVRPMGVRSMGTKPGRPSMRASQARTLEYGASDTPPSGASRV